MPLFVAAGFRNLAHSQASKFEAFLMSSSRYISVLKTGKGMKKLILVKEFPNIFTLHPNLLQDILRLVWKLYIEMFKVHKYSEVVCH